MTTEELETEIGSMLLYQEHGNTVGEHAVRRKIVRAHADMETRIAALEQRAEDAELIAWGFQVKRIRDARTFTTVADAFPDIHWFAETGSAHQYECHDLGTAKNPITLTPAAREALRKAKEQSNG